MASRCGARHGWTAAIIKRPRNARDALACYARHGETHCRRRPTRGKSPRAQVWDSCERTPHALRQRRPAAVQRHDGANVVQAHLCVVFADLVGLAPCVCEVGAAGSEAAFRNRMRAALAGLQKR